ncbi:MAG: 16S rRNA (guanine(527)-N(7))-methyltransferase RsmG [Chloroflexota bacterium]
MSPAADARSARVALEGLLETDAPGIATTLPRGFADAVERFVELLLDANTRLNLTRVTEPDAVARLHLLDSLSALPLLDSFAPSTALDLGSGGGVPGLVLALARPGIRWTLVDSVGKKCDAMRGFADALGLGSVAVVAQRAEILGHDPRHRERYDLVTARACAALPVLAEYALPLVAVGGALVAWKGALSSTDDEAVQGAEAAALLGGGAPAIHETEVRALAQHRLLVIPKERATPAPYPRRPGEPARRPLPRRRD